MASLAEIVHPHLGRIKGSVDEKSGVAKYLGLPYASLKSHFAPAVPVTSYNDGKNGTGLDATSYGPSCYQPPGLCEMEQKVLIQHELPHGDFPISDLKGLSLNITMPHKVGRGKQLPSFVFVHGGGFALGSSAWPQYDATKLVALSQELGRPAIGITINYRIGAAGFLTSREMRDAGYPANNGLHDQRIALQWIQRNIQGFGGDPTQVTFLGQSSGAASGTYHLQSTEPLFSRLVCLSGTSLFIRPIAHEACEAVYEQLVKAFDLEWLPGQQRVQRLQDISLDQIASQAPQLGPVFDRQIIKHAIGFQDFAKDDKHLQTVLPGLSWCQSIMGGYSQFDSSVFATTGAINLVQRPLPILAKTMYGMSPENPQSLEALLRSYKLDTLGHDVPALQSAVLDLATDLAFRNPALAFHHAFSARGQSYFYYLNLGNPWDGPFKDKASHLFDVAILFQNYYDYLPESHRAVAHAFAKDIITFVNGEAPWNIANAPGTMKMYSLNVTSEYPGEKEPELRGLNETQCQAFVAVDRDEALMGLLGYMQPQ